MSSGIQQAFYILLVSSIVMYSIFLNKDPTNQGNGVQNSSHSIYIYLPIFFAVVALLVHHVTAEMPISS